jgi:hypothetical protein
VTDDAGGGDWYAPTGTDPGWFLGPDGTPALHLIPYRDTLGEDVLRLCEDATGLLVSPSDRRLPSIGIYVSQLRGEAYHQGGCRAGDFSPGIPVALVPEPDNPYDRFAVAVYDQTRQHLAAYVNKQKARQIATLLAAGDELSAISIRGTRAGRRCDQVAVLAAEPTRLTRLLDSRPADLPVPAHIRWPNGH